LHPIRRLSKEGDCPLPPETAPLDQLANTATSLSQGECASVGMATEGNFSDGKMLMSVTRHKWGQRLLLQAVEMTPYAALALAQPGGSVSAFLAWLVSGAVAAGRLSDHSAAQTPVSGAH
jgi:hypothetical protein